MQNNLIEDIIKTLIEKTEYKEMGEKTTICLITMRNKEEIIGTSSFQNLHKAGKEFHAFQNAKEKILELPELKQFFQAMNKNNFPSSPNVQLYGGVTIS